VWIDGTLLTSDFVIVFVIMGPAGGRGVLRRGRHLRVLRTEHLGYLHISLPALPCGGGLLLLLVALELLTGHEDEPTASGDSDIALGPSAHRCSPALTLAVIGVPAPLIAGQG
jgi:hypothetical protein